MRAEGYVSMAVEGSVDIVLKVAVVLSPKVDVSRYVGGIAPDAIANFRGKQVNVIFGAETLVVILECEVRFRNEDVI